MIDYQKELDKAYYQYLKNIFQKDNIIECIENNKLSSPQIINVDAPDGKYIAADFRILFVGQETKGWLNPYPENLQKLTAHKIPEYLKKLKDCYYDFNFGNRLNGKKYNGIFRNYTNKIISKLPDKKIGFLTTNLFKHDERQSRISSSKYDLLQFENCTLLQKEIQILDPHLIIFFTGHALDFLISEIIGNGITFNTIESINDQKKFVKITSKNHPIEMFRTYHPNYLNRVVNKQQFVNMGINHIIKSINLTYNKT